MPIKMKLTKDEYEKLSDAEKSYYKADGDNFKPDIDESAIAGEALTARDNMKRERDEAKAENARLKTESETATAKVTKLTSDLEAANEGKGKDIQALEESYKAKVTDLETKLAESDSKFDNQIMKDHKSKIVGTIATEISKTPALMERVIADRISVEIIDGKAIERVLDADGNPSAMSLSDLKKEIVDNKDYAEVVIKSKANGGGAPDVRPGGGAPADNNSQKSNQLNTLVEKVPALADLPAS